MHKRSCLWKPFGSQRVQTLLRQRQRVQTLLRQRQRVQTLLRQRQRVQTLLRQSGQLESITRHTYSTFEQFHPRIYPKPKVWNRKKDFHFQEQQFSSQCFHRRGTFLYQDRLTRYNSYSYHQPFYYFQYLYQLLWLLICWYLHLICRRYSHPCLHTGVYYYQQIHPWCHSLTHYYQRYRPWFRSASSRMYEQHLLSYNSGLLLLSSRSHGLKCLLLPW